MAVSKGKKSASKVRSLPARKLTSKQAKRVKGGIAVALPAVQKPGTVSLADGSVRPAFNPFQKV